MLKQGVRAALRGLGVALAVSALAACANYSGEVSDAAALPETGYSVVRHQRYTPPDWPQALFADVYLPDSAGRRPAVLLVHGGGWERRSRADMASTAERLAQRGFVAVNVSYRFAPQHTFPAQLHDLQLAMHWIHENAGRFDIDTARIGALGYSAGAHLVSLLALVAGEGGELDSPYGGPRTRPDAVVAGGTPSDLRKFRGGTLVPQFLGGDRDDIPERFAQASPVTHVHGEAPPFFLYHGDMDKLVTIDHATDFQRALQQKGVVAELYQLRWRGHITAFLTDGNALKTAMAFLYRQLDGETDGKRVVRQ